MQVVNMTVTPVLHDPERYDDNNWPSVRPLLIPKQIDVRHIRTPREASDKLPFRDLFRAIRQGMSYKDETTGLELSVLNTQKRVRTLELKGQVVMLMISHPLSNGRDLLESIEFASLAFVGALPFELADACLAVLGISPPRYDKGEFSVHAFDQTLRFSQDPLVLTYRQLS